MDYAASANRAATLLKKYGTKCILKNPSGDTVYDPVSNSYIEICDTYEGYAVISAYSDNLVNGTVIQSGDRSIMASLPAEPKPGISKLEIYDKYNQLKETYNVINAAPLSPDMTTVIYYRLQCRR